LHQHFLAEFAQVNPNQVNPNHWSIMASSIAMVAVMALVAFAMISKIRYVHVMNRYFRGRASLGRFVVIVAILGLLLTKLQLTLAAACVTYALSAPLTFAWQHIRTRKK
jgi:phosphatidylserine synthase